MQFFKYFTITVVILALVIPTECGWLRRKLKKVGRKIKTVAKKVVNKVKDGVKKLGCKLVFAVGCPVAIGAVAGAITAGSTGTGAAIVGAGAIAGMEACRVRSKRCKRDVNMTEILLPFSDEMSDYDFNGDKRISYTEFVWAVVTSVPMADPDELMKPFIFADFDGDGELDWQEFQGAPFLFAHAEIEEDTQSAVAA